MREILFRGKRLDNGGWIEGSLWMNLDKPHILTPTNCIGYEVDPATVGQYTGLRDKDGVMIFEGDIIKGRNGKAYAVTYGRNIAGFMTIGTGVLSAPYRNGNIMKDHEVVGSVHDDNPELLEGGGQDGAD